MKRLCQGVEVEHSSFYAWLAGAQARAQRRAGPGRAGPGRAAQRRAGPGRAGPKMMRPPSGSGRSTRWTGLPAGAKVRGYAKPPPNAFETAWLALIPTIAPALSTNEQVCVRSIRDNATDQRVKDRAEAVLSANGTL